MRRTLFLFALVIAASSAASGQRQANDNQGESLAAAAARCTGAQLSAKHEADDAGLGQRDVTYSFRNRSATPCTLKGYAGFVLLDGRGRRMRGQSLAHNSDPAAALVTLAPGGKAYFNAHYSACSTVGTPPCKTSASVSLTAPGTRRAFSLRQRLDPFHLSVSLSPLVATAPN